MGKRNGPRSCGTCGCPDPGGIGVGIPGCVCTSTPATLSLTCTYGVGENLYTYGGAYRSCTLAYYTSAPSYLPSTSFSGPGYYSTTAWVDNYGYTDYFRLTCFATQYTLGLGQGNAGVWLSPGQIYSWSIGGRPVVNFCSPVLLAVGTTQAGVNFNGKFIVS